MSFSYDAGTTTPTYAGLVEFNGVRLNDGTYKTTAVPPIISAPGVRSALSDLPSDHGGYDGTPYLDSWEFDLEGWLWVPTGPDDVPAAMDYLRASFSMWAGLQQLKVKGRGWAQTRYLTARVNGPVSFIEPDIDQKKIPRRDFVIPMAAPDPRLYNADAMFSVNIGVGASGSVTNNGIANSPVTARFVGPLTNPTLNAPGTGGFIELGEADGTDYIITSGHWVEVTTNPSDPGGVGVLDDTGASRYGKVRQFTARTAAPGTHSWSLAADAGSGHVTLTLRDAW